MNLGAKKLDRVYMEHSSGSCPLCRGFLHITDKTCGYFLHCDDCGASFKSSSYHKGSGVQDFVLKVECVKEPTRVPCRVLMGGSRGTRRGGYGWH